MTLKVLTVDDSRTIRRIVARAFKPYDCKITEAENGVEGLAAACKSKPDLIILDITMPVMTGDEMLERLKQEDDLKDVPVIMLTAESGKDNVTRIVKLGVRDYMVKPFKDVQLIERVEKIFTLEAASSNGGKDDSAARFFSESDSVSVLNLPQATDRPILVAIEKVLPEKIEQLQKKGINCIVLNLTATNKVNMVLIKLIILVRGHCQKSSMRLRIAATQGISGDLKGFQETQGIPVDDSVERATSSIQAE